MDSWKENIREILNNDVVSSNLSTEAISYKNVYKGDIGVIAVDIRKYQNICNRYPPETVTKIIQAYSTGIITIGREHKNYLFSSLNGDEVILVYKLTCGDCKYKMNDIAKTINSDFRTIFTNLVWNKFDIKIEFGIGVYSANNQIIAKYGKKYNAKENELTVIGSAINKAHSYAKEHNSIKNKHDQVIW